MRGMTIRRALCRPIVDEYFRLDLAEIRRCAIGGKPTSPQRCLVLAARTEWGVFEIRRQADSVGEQIRLERWGTRESVLLPMRQTRPSFGGVRYWFACPLCSSSSRVLFWKPPSLNPACRRCNGFAYSTQRMAPAARWDHRARRIERRLGGQRDDGVIYKPKHMHWRTYHRLMDAVQEFNDAATLYRMSRDRGMRSVLRGRGLSI
jgi:hypothetical protein